VLVVVQILGGAATACAVAVGALLARDLFASRTLAGAAQASLTLGAAAASIPLARYSVRHGRRPGLWRGYVIGAAGAVLIVVAVTASWWPGFVIGMFAFGTGQATNLQTRFAAADLAEPEARAKAISVVVWATTIGSVLGPNLVGPTSAVAEAVGLPELSGLIVLAAALDVAAATVVAWRLRPDPLVEAGGLGEPGSARGELARALATVRARPYALLAIVAMVTAHAVMVAVMSMTPLHLDDGGQSASFIGFVISMHIAGMYAFAPVGGWLADRFGRVVTLALGGVVLVVATVIGGRSGGHESSPMLGALFLLGFGWSLCLVAGSALVTESVPSDRRVSVQGFSDLCMSGAGGLAGLTAGVLVATSGYHGLSHVAAFLSAALALTVVVFFRRRSSTTAGATR
jgi:MFS family permease